MADIIPIEVVKGDFSDDSLALIFAERHAGDLRYVAPWSRWLAWDGRRWRPDRQLDVFDKVRKVCRRAAESGGDSAARMARSAGTVAAVERLARSDKRLAALPEDFDADPWALNTPGGVIDLRTGELRAHDPADHFIRMTSVSPDSGCPRWLKFMDEITCGDRDLADYLQRVAGYALTGDTREHVMLFAKGGGGNGKSTFLAVLTHILQDYHVAAAVEVFLASNYDRHPTELAALQGARLVTAIETEDGRRWAETRIKTLTGGDTISARFMRGDFFQFRPEFKLIIVGNSAPSLTTVDEAIRRRFHLVPFDMKVAPATKDVRLVGKLKFEARGILGWMIEGCLKWQRHGLPMPAAVHAASAQYLQAQDPFGEWLATCCERKSATTWTGSSTLFASWTKFATAAREEVGSMRKFSQTLATKGFVDERRSYGRGFAGIRLIEREKLQVEPSKDDGP